MSVDLYTFIRSCKNNRCFPKTKRYLPRKLLYQPIQFCHYFRSGERTRTTWTKSSNTSTGVRRSWTKASSRNSSTRAPRCSQTTSSTSTPPTNFAVSDKHALTLGFTGYTWRLLLVLSSQHSTMCELLSLLGHSRNIYIRINRNNSTISVLLKNTYYLLTQRFFSFFSWVR